jgi:sec-independent protein translocase protein TatC
VSTVSNTAAVEGPMSFRDHLEELRSRIIRSVLAVVAGMVVGWNYREQLFAWLLRPLEVAWFCNARNNTPQACTVPQIVHWMLHYNVFRAMRDVAQRALPASTGLPLNPQVHFPDPTSAFTVYLKIAAFGGFVLALPVVFYQLWMFIAPGLYANEKRRVLPMVFFSTLFFVAGALFGYHFVFPVGYAWMLGFGGKVSNTAVTVIPTLMMDEYLGFTSQMLLAFGVVFELPLFIFFLSLVGLVTWRQLLSFSRYFVVIAFILAAVLTPSTDVYSQVMLGLPLIGLYFIAIGLAYLFGPKTAKPWREALTNTLKRSDEPGATPAPGVPSFNEDAQREAKIRDHEAKVAAKIAAAKANEPRPK